TTTFIVQQQGRVKLRDENATLQQQAAQLDGLRAENERLSNLVAGAAYKPSLSNEQFGELLRLRGEMANLRRQTNELGKLRSETRRLKTALPSTEVALPADGVPKESWAFAGYADPESGFQSAIWARSRGDAENFVASLAPGEELEEWKGKTSEQLA